jgi:hypothetical protein
MLLAALVGAAGLGCATGPLIEVRSGAEREFAPGDRFAPANPGVLALENPDLLDFDLEALHQQIESAIGWRGLRTAPEQDADWLISCAFRKRIVWRGDIGSAETFVEPWDPHGRRPRVMGSSGEELRTRGATDPGADAEPPEAFVQTLVELRLRSRRTGSIGWSAERRWGRNRQELPEHELRETLELLLAKLRIRGEARDEPPPEAR